MRNKTWLGGAALFALALLDGSPVGAASLREREAAAWKDLSFQEAAACTKCHTAPGLNDLKDGTTDVVLMTEFAIWKTHDKHAQAYAVLEGPRGQQMGKLLGVDVTKESAGCLSCHAMVNLKDAKGGGVDKLDGVSCGGCHGPSEKWVGPHADPKKGWRKLSADEKFKQGLRDLRDPEVKSALCMSCHIGSAAEGKVVTHAMFAAGHPPLPPIEIATFARNEPQHWRDARDVPLLNSKDTPADILKNYHIEKPEDAAYSRTRLALVGSIVALRETLRLAAERADDQTPGAAKVWPELLIGLNDADAKDDAKVRGLVPGRWSEIAMAHSDCYACHHDLAYPGYRQERGFGFQLPGRPLIRVKAGRPVVRTWPLAVLPVALGTDGKVGDLEDALKRLAAATDVRPFGDRVKVGTAARELVAWADKAVEEVKKTPIDDEKALRLMHALCALVGKPQIKQGEKPLPAPLFDYESARQIASVLRVIYEDYSRRKGEDPKVKMALDELAKELNLQPYFKRADRGKVILEVVRKAGGADQDGVEEFAKYLESPEKLGDKAILEKLVKNRFLGTLSRGVDNMEFTKGLKDPNVVKQLQEFSDAEEEQVLKTLADYSPFTFATRLNDLAKLLPK